MPPNPHMGWFLGRWEGFPLSLQKSLAISSVGPQQDAPIPPTRHCMISYFFRLRLSNRAALSLRGLGWGPPVPVDSMLQWYSQVTLELFLFPNNVRSRDVKGLIIGDESSCHVIHHVKTSLQLAGELLPKEEGKGTRMTWVIGTPQPSGMASIAARGRAVLKGGWRCYGQNSAPLIIR